MKLRNINHVLRKFGFVLVLNIDSDGKKPTELYFQRKSKHPTIRCPKCNSKKYHYGSNDTMILECRDCGHLQLP